MYIYISTLFQCVIYTNISICFSRKNWAPGDKACSDGSCHATSSVSPSACSRPQPRLSPGRCSDDCPEATLSILGRHGEMIGSMFGNKINIFGIWRFPFLGGLPKNGCFIMENHIEMDDLGKCPCMYMCIYIYTLW